LLAADRPVVDPGNLATIFSTSPLVEVVARPRKVSAEVPSTSYDLVIELEECEFRTVAAPKVVDRRWDLAQVGGMWP